MLSDRRFANITLLVVLALSVASIASAEPDAAEVFDSLYGKEIQRVRATRPGADDVALAQTLYEASDQAVEQPALMRLILERAIELAMADPGGYETAAAALNRQAAGAESTPDTVLKSFEQLMALRQRQYSAASIREKPGVAAAYLDDLIAYGDLLTESDDHKAALAIYRKALAIGRNAESDMRDELVPRISRAGRLDRAFGQINKYKMLLKNNSSNAEAARNLLLVYIVQLDRPAEARKFSFVSSDDQLKANISAAATPLEQVQTADLLRLGDWYSELAESVAAEDPDRLAMYNHAREYYETYLARDDKQGLGATKAKLALARAADHAGEIEQKLEALAEAQRGGGKSKFTDVLSKVKLGRHTERGAWAEQNGMFACQAGSDAVLRIPVTPEGSYEVKFRLQRNFGQAEIGINLPVGGRMVTFVAQGLRGQFTGISNIDGWMYYDNVTRNNRGGLLPFKSSVTVFARVQVDGKRAKIYCSVGGRRCVNWTGRIRQLSAYHKWAISPNSLGVVCDYGNLIVQSAELRLLDEK